MGGGVAPLFYASAACIAISVVFNFSSVVCLYFGRNDELARSVFDVEQAAAPKLFFFLVMLLAGFVNIRLAALLPWKQASRRNVLVRLQRLYLAGKCIEDLPQLGIAAAYLAGRSASGELSGSGVGTAILNMVISGASFLLTLIWLGLQVADSSRRRIVKTPSDASGMRKWISRGRLKGSTPPQADVTIVKSTTHLELKADEPANRASWTSEAVVTEEEKV